MSGRSGQNPVPRTVPTYLCIGERFNPHRDACGFFAPDLVDRQKNLTPGQKRLYGRLVRWAGKNGCVWYGFERIGAELGISSRQIKRDVAVLEKYCLIEHERRGKRQTNLYFFLYHSMFQSEVTSASLHPKSEVTYPQSEVTSTSLGEVTSASLKSIKRNCVRECSSSENESDQITDRVEDRSSDDEPLSSNENPNPDFDPDFPLILSGEERGGTDPLMDSGALPGWFIDQAAKSLHASKCTTLLSSSDLTLFPPPDRQITVQIAESWRGKGILAFFDWLCSTVERRLGHKGRATTVMVYGLYRRDSEECAKGWQEGVFISEKIKYRLRSEQAAAQQQAEEKYRRLLMETPVTLAVAISTLNSERPGWMNHVAGRFLWLFQRTTMIISPENLLKAASSWRQCRNCLDGGLIGQPLKGTFKYCDCQIGQQERIERGDTYPGDEIRRVHATFRSRFIQACRELKLDFTGDAVAHQATEIVECDSTVHVLPTQEFQLSCEERDLRRALDYMGDKRDVILIGPAVPSSNFKAHGIARAPAGKAKEPATPAMNQQQTAISS
jgi:hypothetical protein